MNNQTQNRRIERERKTIRAMLEINCRDHHAGSAGLCPACSELLAYALQRIERCPYGVDKPTCAKCPIHCYRPEQREEIRRVMRHAGPRILLRHPILTLQHFLDEWTIAAPQKINARSKIKD